MKRCFDEVDADETPLGYEPRPEDIDLEDSGVDLETLRGLLSVDRDLWLEDVAAIRSFYAKFGDKLPGTRPGTGCPGSAAEIIDLARHMDHMAGLLLNHLF